MAAFATSDKMTTSASKSTSLSSDEAPAKPTSKYYFRWTSALVVTLLTLALFFMDFLLLDADSRNNANSASLDAVLILWNLFRSSSWCCLDVGIGGSLLAFIMFKMISRKAKQPKPAFSNKTKKSGNTRRIDSVEGAVSDSKDPVATARAAAERATSKWNQAIDQAARQGDVKKAAGLLVEFARQGGDDGSRPDTVSYNLVIRAFAKKGDFTGAVEWLSRMEASGLTATVCSYNTVLDACAKADRAEACEAWLKTMLKKGIEANVISYATAIYAWARRGEDARAKEWFQKMLSAEITPDAVCFNSMIHACGVSGNAAGAEHWIKEMEACGIPASVTTFTTVIDACAKAGDVERAEKWLETMMSAKVEPNVVSFSAMIDACAKSANPSRAKYWHERMVQCGVQPNAHSYSAVINACAKAGDVAMAEDWLAQAENAGVANDVVLYSSVVDACGKAGDSDRAMAVFERMQKRGIRAHIVTYAALARPFAYRGDWTAVERIADEMEKAGVKTNEYFLYAQLLSYATSRPRHSQRAEQCFRAALRSGLKANDHVVGALARAVGRERCMELMDELCDGRSVPLPPTGKREGGGGKPKPAPRRQ